MPPSLALVLCSLFVIVLLTIEHQKSKQVSYVSWIPTIWMFYIASKPLGVWFGLGEQGDLESGSGLDRLFLTCLLCLGLVMLVKRKLNYSGILRQNIWLVVLLGYMFVSIAWSDIPFISLKRWSRELIAVIMSFLIATETYPRAAMESIFRRVAYVLIPFSVLLIKYFPDTYGVKYNIWTGERMWVGVTLQKNGLGRLCLISAFFLVWSLVWRRKGQDSPVYRYLIISDILILAITLWLLKGPPGAFSATATTTFLVGIGILLLLFWLKKRQIIVRETLLIVVMLSLICIGSMTPFTGGLTVSKLASYVGRDQTLTGRTDIWKGLLPEIKQRPILGYGFGGFWTTETVDKHWDSEAHSGYLDVLLSLGIVGLALNTLFILSCCRKAHKELFNNYDWACLFIGFLIMAALHNIAESSIHLLTSHLTATLVFLAVSLRSRNALQGA